MRRPIVLILISFISGIMFFHYADYIIKCIAVSVGFVILTGRRNYRNPLILLIIISFAAAGISVYSEDQRSGGEMNLNGKEAVLEGTVFSYGHEEADFGGSRVSFILKEETGRKYQVTWYTHKEQNANLTGKKVIVRGTFEKPSVRRNPGTFDYSTYLKSKGIRYLVKCDDMKVINEKSDNIYLSFINYCVTLRDNFTEKLEKYQKSSTAGVEKGIMFGIKDDMEDTTYEEFQKNGTAHLLATSGLHMGIIYGVMSRILNPSVRLLPNLFIVFMMYSYVIMADFNPSIIRAFIMILFSVAGRITCRKYDLISSTCGAGLLMLIYNPYYIFSTGFQMSYLAVFIMGFTLNKIKYLDLKEGAAEKLMPVIIIQLVMAPYIWYNFNYFSFSSFIANPPVTAMASWILMSGTALMALDFINVIIPPFLIESLGSLTELMLSVNRFTYSNGDFTKTLKSPSLLLIFLFYGIVFLCLNEETIILYIRKKYRKIALMMTVVVIVAVAGGSYFKTGFEDCNMFFLDVGQGNAMLFISDDGKTLLVDGGGKADYPVGIKTLMPALLKNGIKEIDYAYVSHWDTDHYKGIEEIAGQGMVKNIITYEGNIINRDEIERKMSVPRKNIHYLCRNDSFKVGTNIKVRILAPEKKNRAEYEDELVNTSENNRSLISKISLNDTDFLITGDIDTECEKELVNKAGRNLRADILQVPHHGSHDSSSDELIEAVNPVIAVFQCGKNNYGHPAPQIVEKYREKGIITYRNDHEGAIGLTVGEDNKVAVKTVIEPEESMP